MSNQLEHTPSAAQTFTSTAYFDVHGHRVVDADGPATGHLGLGYQFRLGRRNSPGRWVIAVTLSPALYDQTGAKIIDAAAKRPLTIAQTAVHGELDLAADPTATPPQASIVFDHYHLDTPDPDSRRARTVHAALTQLSEQVFAFFHTPHRLHAAKIDHTAREIAAIDKQILDHCSAVFPRRAAAIRRRNQLIAHPPAYAEDPATAPDPGPRSHNQTRTPSADPRDAHA
ncbi:hypothetical protein [Nocardia brasiliensis]|uniref:hypothetical protein n=1 Tax=Nocardia brasiliensis TaxID=37326 RepID=UPI002458004B|nr:hypothetical protein [Nocardia brasiliensis]